MNDYIGSETRKFLGTSTFEEACELFNNFNSDSYFEANEELRMQIPREALFCMMANYEWKRLGNQGGSDIEEDLHHQVSAAAMQYINALVKFWGNAGHPGIPFTLYNGINYDNIYNVWAKAEEEKKRLPVYFGSKR